MEYIEESPDAGFADGDCEGVIRLKKIEFDSYEYEKYVFTTFTDLLKKDELLVNSKKSKVIFHPKYYSDDRRSFITFDIAIETRLNEEDTNPSFLTLIECKYYTSRVPVSDVEEFVSKVRQVSRLNVKAIFVTNNIFQSSALTYGIANKVGMARLIPEKPIIWESKRTTSIDKNQIPRFVQEYVTDCLLYQVESSNSFIGLFNGTYTTDIYIFLYEYNLISSYSEPSNISDDVLKAGFIHHEEIENIAEEILDKFWKNYKSNDRMEMIESGIKDLYGLDIIENEHLGMLHDELILGKINFNSSKIFISKIIKKDDPRWIFTLVHEFSHFILHKNRLLGIQEEMIDSTITLLDTDVSNKSFFQFEWQANSLAACLLTPRKEFVNMISMIFEKNHITKLPLYLDFQPVNRILCEKITVEIAKHFKCSKRVVFIRLKELKLLEDHLIKTPKNLLYDIFSNFDNKPVSPSQEQ